MALPAHHFLPLSDDETVERIIHTVNDRRAQRGFLFEAARKVKDLYNGEVTIPLPEMDEDEHPAVANLLQQGLDQTAQRISSTRPDIRFHPARRGIKKWEDKARNQRQVSVGWLERNDYDLLTARRARHLVGYSMTPVFVGPDRKTGHAKWQIQDPLDTYPADIGNAGNMVPDDCAFLSTRNLRWLRDNYPGRVGFIPAQTLPRFRQGKVDERTVEVELIQFVSADEITLIATGISSGKPMDVEADYGRSHITWDHSHGTFRYGVVLERSPNLAGRPLVIVPGRITLDRPMGQFDGMIGKFLTQAELAALELIAIREGVFPEKWLVSHPNTTTGKAEILVTADGPQGIIGEIEGGTIMPITSNPSYRTDQAIDRLERWQRLEGSIPAEFGGESPTNVRTGRRGDAVLSAAIDFNIAEAQKVLERSEKYELEAAIEVAKGYHGNRTVSFYVDWKGARGPAQYRANELFDEYAPPTVKYALAGADLNAQIVRHGQKLGLGLWSKQTAREQDPETDDPELERDRIVAEGVMDALLASIQTQAADPMGPYQPEDLAELAELVITNKMELPAAIKRVQELAEQRQAQVVEPGSPEAQPGLNNPAVEPPPAIEEPSENQRNLSMMLNQLRNARTSIGAAERAGV